MLTFFISFAAIFYCIAKTIQHAQRERRKRLIETGLARDLEDRMAFFDDDEDSLSDETLYDATGQQVLFGRRNDGR